jgi:hypothetical protein
LALEPAAFRACFADRPRASRAAAAAETGLERPVLAADGETSRRSHDRDKGPGALHPAGAWASDFGLSLGQAACAEESNELTAIPELLRPADIEGAIITIGAMGARKAIAEQVIGGARTSSRRWRGARGRCIRRSSIASTSGSRGTWPAAGSA